MTRVTGRRTRVLVLACAVVLGPSPAALAQTDSASTFTIDDVLRLETLGSVAASPDGRHVAIVVERARSAHERYPMPWLQGDARADIWIAVTDSGRAVRLTNGGADGAGYWDPVWSPDGERLAMLSNAGDGLVRAYVWTARDRAPLLMSERPVDRSVVSNGGEEQFQPLAWGDDSTLNVLLLPQDTSLRADPFDRSDDRAERERQTVHAGGARATASVLESIPGSVPHYLTTEDLVAIDVRTRRTTRLVTLPRDPTTSGRRGITLAPGGRAIAVATSELEAPLANERLTRSMVHYRIGLVTLGRDSLRWIGAFVGSDDGAGGPPALRWAPDRHALLILGRKAGGVAGAPCGFVVDVRTIGAAMASTELRGSTRAPWAMPPVSWCGAGTWVGSGAALLQTRDEGGHPGWWVVSAELPPRDVTSALGADARPLVSVSTSVIDVATERDWSIDSRGARVESKGDDSHEHGHVVWISPPSDDAARTVIVGSSADAEDSLTAVTVTGDQVRRTRLGILPKGWRVVTYAPAVHSVIAQQGNRAIAVLGPAGLHILLGINAWAARIAPPIKRAMRYRSESGDSLTAIVMLPPTYVAGHRYPVVTWVYAGMVYSDTDGVDADPYNSSQLNLGLLAAQGYVVLLPSMPIGDHAHVLAEMPGTVLPAVDRLVALGIADPDRVAVMGQSFGGYSTVGLITQTHRFRSAIALAVISDFMSAYGTYRPWDRYRSDAQVTLATPKMDEAGQPGLGSSPWADPWRYFMNSPVLFADRVDTPVLLIQGDLDFEGPEQAEEYFTALYRLGKRAVLVRYVGEGHVIESPANVRDMWMRVMRWLTDTMGSTVPSAPPAHLGVQ